MKMNYTMKELFQNLYQQMPQKYVYALSGNEDFEQWRQGFRKELEEILGLPVLTAYSHEKKHNRGNSVKKMESIQEEGYLREKYAIETLPGVWMPFHMLVPGKENSAAGEEQHEKQGGNAAIIAFPAHGANKNTVAGVGETPEEREKIAQYPGECYGLEFVRRGYTVFCPDPAGYGERGEAIAAEDNVFQPDRVRSSLGTSCKDLAQTAEALGFSLTGLAVWEFRILLDYICGRADIDPARIGCAGFSGGGQASMWLAALDDRIALTVVSGYVHGYYETILECHLCPCNYVPGLWQLGDISDICSLIAPRPLFIENGTEDVENGVMGIAGPVNQVKKIRQAYQAFRAEHKVEHAMPSGPHRWYGECYSFVEDNL